MIMKKEKAPKSMIFTKPFDLAATMRKLRQQAAGTWLMRESNSINGIISLSGVQADEAGEPVIHHRRFAFCKGNWYEYFKSNFEKKGLQVEPINGTDFDKLTVLIQSMPKIGYLLKRQMTPESHPSDSRYVLFRDPDSDEEKPLKEIIERHSSHP